MQLWGGRTRQHYRTGHRLAAGFLQPSSQMRQYHALHAHTEAVFNAPIQPLQLQSLRQEDSWPRGTGENRAKQSQMIFSQTRLETLPSRNVSLKAICSWWFTSTPINIEISRTICELVWPAVAFIYCFYTLILLSFGTKCWRKFHRFIVIFCAVNERTDKITKIISNLNGRWKTVRNGKIRFSLKRNDELVLIITAKLDQDQLKGDLKPLRTHIHTTTIVYLHTLIR